MTTDEMAKLRHDLETYPGPSRDNREPAMSASRPRTVSRCIRNPAFSRFTSSRHRRRCPPRSAFRADRAFPSAVRGPVERSHGRHRQIASACRARRSAVHPFTLHLQKFVLHRWRLSRGRERPTLSRGDQRLNYTEVHLCRWSAQGSRLRP